MKHLLVIIAFVITAGHGAVTTANPTAAGVWRFRALEDGLEAKCIDVGGYPTGLSSPVMLFDCNGTKAQEITVVPLGPTYVDDVELRAFGRCLTVALDHYEAGASIVLAPCGRRLAQRFLGDPLRNPGVIVPSAARDLRVAVRGADGANRTPLTLEFSRDFPRDGIIVWNLERLDAPASTWTPVVATAGAYAFKGLAGKCVDIGGPPHRQRSPAFLFDCNGSLAQFFMLRQVDEHLGHFTLGAFGRCLDIGGAIPRPWGQVERAHAPTEGLIDGGEFLPLSGPPLVLNACSGAASQRFAFDNFDRQYIYPVGRPDWVIGVRGGRADNRTPLELQSRSRVAYQNWLAQSVEHDAVGPKAPVVRFTAVRHTDHRDGRAYPTYWPVLDVRDETGPSATYDVYWKPLGEGNYNQQSLGRSHEGTGQILSAYISDIKNTNQVYVAKARATYRPGLFSESPEIIIDGRVPVEPSVQVENVQDDELTVVWHAAGTAPVNSFRVRVTPTGTFNYIDAWVNARPNPGAANLVYQKRVTGLQPNSRYGVAVEADHELWGSNWSNQADVMTLPAASNPGPFTTTVWMQRQVPYEGYIYFVGTFGPFPNGAVISRINFPERWPPVALLISGHHTNDCGDPDAVVVVHGDMTAAQEVAVWGTSDLLSRGQVLTFVGCSSPSPGGFLQYPVNITWSLR